MDSHFSFHNFLRFAWENSAFYRKLYHSYGIRESDLDHITLQDLPIVTKQMALDNFDELVTDPRIRKAALEEWLEHDHDPRSRFLGEFLVIHSSGSSGIQASIVYNESTWRSMTAAAAVYMYPRKLPNETRYHNAFYIGDREHVASATTAMNSSQAVFDRMVVSMKDPVEETIAHLNDFQPDRLTSYSSSLGWLAELALDGKLRISPRDAVVSSDRMTPAVEAKIRQAWNPNIYDLYAAVESLFIAVKRPGQAEWKVLDELQMIEVLDANNQQVKAGGMGRAVLTNWTNRTLPLIRYDLTDYVICGENQPGNTTLRGFVGQSFDNLPIRLDDGRTSEIPSYELANFATAGLDAFQFVSFSPDKVEVQYCAREDMDGVLQVGIAGLLAKWGGARTKFSIWRVDHIWNDAASGKVKLVRRPGDPQIGLPAHTLSAGPAENPTDQLRPGSGFVPFAPEQLEDSIAAVFERQAARRPDATAVNDGALRLTYAELNRTANRAAYALRARQMDPAYPVALLFNHKAAMITAMLGVLKAGGWYTPLDPAHPLARNTAILHEIGAGLVLTDRDGLASARSYGFSDGQVINLDEFNGAVDEGNLGLPTTPDAPACILYTSGSTGQPKGVVLDQRAVLHRAMLYTNDYAIGQADRLSLLQSYVFNASVREIYAALLNGAGLYIYSIKRDGIHHLASWLEEEGITVLYMVPSTWRVFLDMLKGERFEQLRVIRLGGEAVLARDVEGFQHYFGPGCLLANGLASTETGTICQYFMNHQTRVVGNCAPAGFPVQNKDVSLLDEDGRPVQEAAIGEIVVASAYMGPGYFPQASSRVETPVISNSGTKRVIHTGDLGYHMPDGRIVLVGRKDWQVKLRGQRMNLLEIEQTLLSLENVAEAAVTLQGGKDGAAFLAAYIQPKAQPTPSEDALRRGLRALLPKAMVPVVFMFFDQLPRTESGKVDRQALPAAELGAVASHSSNARRATASPETPIELALAEIWHDLLGIEEVGKDDNFFDLGGDSLQASAMMARIEARFKRRFPVSALFQYETLCRLAGYIAAEDGTGPQGLLVSIQPLGDKPPVFFIPGLGGNPLSLRDLTANLGCERPLYALQEAGFGDPTGNIKTIEQAAEQYVGEVQAARPHGPYILVGYSFGGHLAIETARRLAVPGEAEPLVVLIDTYPPVPLRRITTLEKHVWFHLNNLRKLNGVWEVADYFRDLVQRILLRLIRLRPAWAIAEQLGAPDSSPVSDARIALTAYKPKPYPGRVVLFKASQFNGNFGGDPMDHWEKFISSELEIRIVPGDHTSLIKNPQAIEVARQLQMVLG